MHSWFSPPCTGGGPASLDQFQVEALKNQRIRHASRSKHVQGGDFNLLSRQFSARSPLLRVWRALVDGYHAVEATSWGDLLLGNVWPAYLFAMPLGARVWGLA